MTKTEFKEQFKRLRIAGYRLPVFDGVSIDDVMDEWYGTFANCTAAELSEAIDRLKKVKTDTFWPATGQLWEHISEIRRARAIKAHAKNDLEWPEVDGNVRQQLAEQFRSFADQLANKMSMPKTTVQVAPGEEST